MAFFQEPKPYLEDRDPEQKRYRMAVSQKAHLDILMQIKYILMHANDRHDF